MTIKLMGRTAINNGKVILPKGIRAIATQNTDGHVEQSPASKREVVEELINSNGLDHYNWILIWTMTGANLILDRSSKTWVLPDKSLPSPSFLRGRRKK